MGLIEHLGEGPVALDTCILIYFMERHPEYSPMIRPLFLQAKAGERKLYTSAISLLEVLVAPIRHGDTALWRAYERLLRRTRELQLVRLTQKQLVLAAAIRGTCGLRTPDALQAAAAVASGCRVLVTNDRQVRAIPGLQVAQLGDVR